MHEKLFANDSLFICVGKSQPEFQDMEEERIARNMRVQLVKFMMENRDSYVEVNSVTKIMSS